MMTGLGWERITQALAMLDSGVQEGRRTCIIQDYVAPNVSQTVSRVILSYTDYVNRVVWRQS
jgi:UDP-N-acetylglucosamine 2-epimerase (non-hydrolysing)